VTFGEHERSDVKLIKQGNKHPKLYDRDLAPGRYTASFSSARWAGGVYFYRLESGGRFLAGRLIVER